LISFQLNLHLVTICSNVLFKSTDVSEQLEISSPIVAPILSTTPALTSVMVCMAIMAVCAVAYFAIHCYLEERRLSQSPILPCKCGKAANATNGNQIELGSAPRQVGIFT
jgi:hypothetical protein